ncbi:hypothetical protein E2C01_050817 [Portunus trituberculatus]|uniref:Uncharacterized protein n=1 Tax=Portunus trituberculatus TaxID=210409 RepID=A0A5B7G9Z6_PORTR|nr:hypothetical protein [Portunus trituberculatus]
MKGVCVKARSVLPIQLASVYKGKEAKSVRCKVSFLTRRSSFGWGEGGSHSMAVTAGRSEVKLIVTRQVIKSRLYVNVSRCDALCRAPRGAV